MYTDICTDQTSTKMQKECWSVKHHIVEMEEKHFSFYVGSCVVDGMVW